MIPRRRLLNEKLRDVIGTETGLPTEIGRPPSDSGVVNDLPYIIIYPIPGGNSTSGPYCAGHQISEFHYYIKAFGRREDQVAEIADAVREVLLGSTNNSYTNDLNYTSHNVTDRYVVGSGDKLDYIGSVFSSTESYCFTVTAS